MTSGGDAPGAGRRARPRSPLVERRSNTRDDEARRRHHDAIYTLARAAERHDPDTGDHVMRIRRVVERIAASLGLDEAEALGYDAMLHDVGKLIVPETILRKPDVLTDDERAVMASHTIEGERLLTDRPSLARAARIARSHHERWDGSGSPDGLRGEAIPLEARITAAADVLDALVSERCYKEAWTYDDAVAEVVQLAGRHLDPAVVAAIERLHADGALEPIFTRPTRA